MQDAVGSPQFRRGLVEAIPSLKSLRGHAARAAAWSLPYGIGAPALSWFCGQSWVQGLFFRRHYRALDKSVMPIATPACYREELKLSLLNNIMGSWRLVALARCSPETYERWVTVEGSERLKQAYAQARKVIVLGSHYGLPRFAVLAVSRLGYEVHSIEAEDLLNRLKIRGLKPITVTEVGSKRDFLLREVYIARRALTAGAVLHIAADGVFGDSGITLPFNGRKERFAAGFAELALACGAIVLPMFATLDAAGRARVEFLDPLDPGSPTLPKKQRSEFLIRQYVDILERRWRESPGHIRWVKVSRFCTLPEAGNES